MQNLVTKVPLKNCTPGISIPQINPYQNWQRNSDIWGIILGGHQNYFKILLEIFLQNSVTKVPFKTYTFGVSISLQILVKICLWNRDPRGTIFEGNFCGVQKPRNSRGSGEQRKTFSSKEKLSYEFNYVSTDFLYLQHVRKTRRNNAVSGRKNKNFDCLWKFSSFFPQQ